MKGQAIPAPVVRRLSLYLRQLEYLATDGVEKVSSLGLAGSLNITAAQVRKDLACFGQFGRPGVGYLVKPLIGEFRRILGTDKTWNVIAVGAGDLGRALLRYKGFRRKGFRIVAAFDVSQTKVGRVVGGTVVRHIRELPEVIAEHGVRLAVVAVPVQAAQEMTNLLCAAGIKGILNFAPATLQTPPDVAVRPVDLAAELEQLSFIVGSAASERSAGMQGMGSRG